MTESECTHTSICSRKGRFLLVSAKKETTRLRAEVSDASVWSSCSSFNLPIKNNGVRKWFENKLLRGSFSQASRWICAFVSKVVMYIKPKYTLKSKYSFWNLSIPQGLPSLLTYLFLAYPNPNFTPKWISGPITVASIWITTIECGKYFFFLFSPSILLLPLVSFGLPWWLNESACNAGDPSLISRSRRSPGGGGDNLLQYSCLGNSMDRGAWQAIVHGVAKSWTWLSDWHFHFSLWLVLALTYFWKS